MRVPLCSVTSSRASLARPDARRARAATASCTILSTVRINEAATLTWRRPRPPRSLRTPGSTVMTSRPNSSKGEIGERPCQWAARQTIGFAALPCMIFAVKLGTVRQRQEISRSCPPTEHSTKLKGESPMHSTEAAELAARRSISRSLISLLKCRDTIRRKTIEQKRRCTTWRQPQTSTLMDQTLS
jgi:hypothetical protein